MKVAVFPKLKPAVLVTIGPGPGSSTRTEKVTTPSSVGSRAPLSHHWMFVTWDAVAGSDSTQVAPVSVEKRTL